jgi:hypothetical protein
LQEDLSDGLFLTLEDFEFRAAFFHLLTVAKKSSRSSLLRSSKGVIYKMADRRVSVEQQSSNWLSSEHLQQHSEATAARHDIKRTTIHLL